MKCKLLFLSLISIAVGMLYGETETYRKLSEELDIVPMPKEIQLDNREVGIHAEACCIIIGEEASKQSEIGADWINERVMERKGMPLAVINDGKIPSNKIAIIMGTVIDNPLIKKAVSDGLLNVGDKNPGERGYEIKVSSDKKTIYIGGADAIGALYGCVTFGELLKGEGEELVWRSSSVRDWPDQIKLFTLVTPFSSEDPSFPDIPRTVTEATRKTYLDGVSKFHELLLRRKFTGVNYRRKTLNGIVFKHSPWMDLVREGIQHGKDRGIGALIYAEKPFPGLMENYPKEYEQAQKDNKITIGVNNRGIWMMSWSLDDIRRETAKNLAKYVEATGFTDVGFHDTDGGGFDNPAGWNFRSEFDKKRWGDDYTAATIHIHKIYYDELKKLNPDLNINFTFYPYGISIFDAKAFSNILSQTVGSDSVQKDIVEVYQKKYSGFWSHLNDAFPHEDVTFCARESTWDSVIGWRKHIGHKRGIIWWDAIGSRYWQPLFSQGPAWTVDFADNINNIILVAYADTLIAPFNTLAVREYSWNRKTPGQHHFQPYYAESTDYWKWAEPEGDIYSIVLPRIIRNIFGVQAAPYMLKAISQNIDPAQALGQVRSSTYDTLKTPERWQWLANSTETAADSLNELWEKCQENKNTMGMDDHAFCSFLVLREVLNGGKWYSKTKAELMNAEKFASDDKLEVAGQAIARALEYATAGRTMMEQLIKERPTILKTARVPATAMRLMADTVVFTSLFDQVEKVGADLAQIAEDSSKNKLILKQLDKGRNVYALSITDSDQIKLDGKLDESVWSQAHPIDCFTIIGQRKLAEAYTRAKIITDGKKLYISWFCQAPVGREIQDKDTIDIFLQHPKVNDSKLIEIFSSADGSLISNIPPDKRIDIKVIRTSNYWCAEVMIPEEILSESVDKDSWSINICRNCYYKNKPVQITSILPYEASNKRMVSLFPKLQVSKLSAPLPSILINIKNLETKTVTFSDRVASAAYFNVDIESNIVLNNAILFAETYGVDGKLQQRYKLDVFDTIYLGAKPKVLYEAAFTDIVEKGGIFLRLESVEGVFSRWFRFGGWEGSEAKGALFEQGVNEGQALDREVFFTGNKDIFDSEKATVEFFFKLKKDSELINDQPSYFVGTERTKKNSNSLGSLYLGILVHRNRIYFYIGGGNSGSCAIMLPRRFNYNEWHHLACVLESNAEENNMMRIYLDGKHMPSNVSIRDRRKGASRKVKLYTATPRTVQLGAMPSGYYPSKFLMDEFRISRSARYHGDFDIKPEALNRDSDTSVLLHFDGNLEDGESTKAKKLEVKAGFGGI